MKRNYADLIGLVYLVFGSKSKFADAMGMSRPTMDKKLSGESDWTQGEIKKACGLLDIEKKDIPTIFFPD